MLILLAVLIVSGNLFAQNPNASLTGTVSDITGAIVPGVAVTLTNEGTGVSARSVTNDVGIFRANDLIPGTYSVKLSKEGYKELVRKGIELHIQAQVSLTFVMDVGSVTESVTVASGALALDTDSPTVGQVIEGRQVEDMPLNGRNVMNLVALVPGVVPQGTTSGMSMANQNGTFTNPAGWSNYQIGGSVAGWNVTFLDGMPVNVSNQNWLSLVPTQESIDEFKVDSNAVSSQYGRFAGGVVSYSTKSGTNDFHGSAYELLRNTVLNANAFFSDRAGLPKAVLIQNQFGTSLGGPIMKDKSFFFFSYEGMRRVAKAPTTGLVPGSAELGGNFTAAGDPVIYDPTTGQQFQCNGILNVICPSRLDSAAQAMVAAGYWRAPNTSGPGYNFSTNTRNDSSADQYVGRFDQQLTANQRLFVRYSDWKTYLLGGPSTSSLFRGNLLNSRTDQGVIGDSYLISPSLNADFRSYFNRFIYTVYPTGSGSPNLEAIGPAYVTLGAQEPLKAFPVPQILGYATPGNNFQISNHDVYGLSGSLTKTHGLHSIIFGGEARRVEWYNQATTYTGGQFSLTGSFTKNATTNAGGSPIADFDLGLITQANATLSNTGGANNVSLISANQPLSAFDYYQGYYVSDTYKVRRNLTATLGVRWELPGDYAEKHDKDTVLEPNAASPLGSITNPVTGSQQTLTGILAVVNSPLYSSRNEEPAHLDLIDPRIGINYSPTTFMVIRAGFGISQPGLDAGSSGPSSSPVNSASTSPSGTLSNPFPNGILPSVGHNTSINLPYSQFSNTLASASISSRITHQSFPTVYQWNFGVELSLPSHATAEVSYVGSHGSHLTTENLNLNELSSQYYSQGASLLTKVANNPLVGLVNASSTILSANSVAGQFLRPYPQFLSVTSAQPWRGSTSYNSLQVKAQKRFGGGASVLASYTWSKLLSDFDTQNAYLEGRTVGTIQDCLNPRGSRPISDFDARNRAIVSYILDMPFGRGRRFLANPNAVAGRIVFGWTASGITTFQTGFPLSFIYGPGTVLQQNFGAGQSRPNVVAGCAKAIGGSRFSRISTTPWFNTACFSAPSLYGFGNESRVDSQLRADGIDNWDFTMRKNTALSEKVSLDFRAEIFNIFNHPQFSGPSTSYGTSTFGKVTSTANQPRQTQLSLSLDF